VWLTFYNRIVLRKSIFIALILSLFIAFILNNYSKTLWCHSSFYRSFYASSWIDDRELYTLNRSELLDKLGIPDRNIGTVIEYNVSTNILLMPMTRKKFRVLFEKDSIVDYYIILE